MSIKSLRPGVLNITHVAYDFLSLLPSSEPLVSRGRRLQDTSLQRQTATYGSDVFIKVEVEEANQKLLVNFVDDSRLVLAQGEYKAMKLWFSNAGTRSIGEIWLVAGTDDELWVDFQPTSLEKSSLTESLHSENSIASRRPFRIPLDQALAPGADIELSVVVHADRVAEHDLCLLLIFRETETQPFHSTRVTRYYEVTPIFEISATSQPSSTSDQLFMLNMELENVSSNAVQLTQVTTLSPQWNCDPVSDHIL